MNKFAPLDKAKHNIKNSNMAMFMFTTVNVTKRQLYVVKSERDMAQSVSQSVDKHKGLVRIVSMCVIVSSISSVGSSHI
jgi:hypothetical protein